MKLKNITKSVIAASALTVASFGANASAIATVDLDIKNFIFAFQDSLGNAIDNSAIQTTPVDFTNSQSSATVNLVQSPGSLINTADGFDITATNGTGMNTTGTGSYGLVSFTGALNEVGGANGQTFASSSAYGASSASASADVVNSFDATFNLNIHCQVDCVDTTVQGAALFSWNLDILLDVFDQGQNANASWEFGYSIKKVGSLFAGHDYDLMAVDQGALNSLGKIEENISGAYGLQDTFGLLWNTDYTVTITQKASSGVTSVPEPTSVAILGLGLLGLAGAARRRKS